MFAVMKYRKTEICPILESITLTDKNDDEIEIDLDTLIDILYSVIDNDDTRVNKKAWRIQSKMTKANSRWPVQPKQCTRTNAWPKNDKKKWATRKQEWTRKQKSNKKTRA